MTQTEHRDHTFRCYYCGKKIKAWITSEEDIPRAEEYHRVECQQGPDANLRVLGPLPRFTDAWKRLYLQRMSIERIYRSLKHSRGLEGHCVRGLRKIMLHATLSVLTCQATVPARLKARDVDRIRQMTVKMA